MTAAQVAAYVNQVAQTAQLGGRCTPVDDARCILYDCGNWTSAMHQAVRTRFHACSIRVVPFETSISGFVVIFDLGTVSHRLRTACTVAGALAAIAIASAHLARLLPPELATWPETLNASATF